MIEKDKIPEYYRFNNILLEDYKAIFFFQAKVASTSLKTLIAEIEGITFEGNVHFDVRFKFADTNYLFRDYSDYFKFTIVRNPWDRLVSCYKNKIREETFNSNTFKNGVEFNLLKYGSIFYGGMSFNKFARCVASIPDEKSDKHFRSQHPIIINNHHQLLVDFIGKIENLEDDINKIIKACGIPMKSIPRLNTSKKQNYQEYYNDETKDLIFNRYKKDILLFNYDF